MIPHEFEPPTRLFGHLGTVSCAFVEPESNHRCYRGPHDRVHRDVNVRRCAFCHFGGDVCSCVMGCGQGRCPYAGEFFDYTTVPVPVFRQPKESA
jgi:hypothetical protein